MRQDLLFESVVRPRATKGTLRLAHHRIALVKEATGVYTDTPPVVKNAQDAAGVILNVTKLHQEAQEVFGIICLSTKNRVLAVQEISRGTLNGTMVHPREVFKTVLLHNAAAVILYHNHPSGDVTPSEDDIVTTKRLVEAGELLDIKVLDHIIVGPQKNYFSFGDKQLM